MASRSGSSRRKPAIANRADSESEEEKNGINGDQGSDVEMEDLPEGTVVVKPQPVNKKGTFTGPEFRNRNKDLDTSNSIGRVSCTACSEQINTNKSGAARQHPQLGVLICKNCYKYHTSGPISRDADGLDEQCRWCSEGGKLFGCDFCHNAFCKTCIIRNLGRSEMTNVTDEDKQWKCYRCNPKPLRSLVKECNKVLDYMELQDKKAKEKAKMQKSDTNSTPKSDNKKENKNLAKVSGQQSSSRSSSPSTVTKPTENKNLLRALTSSNQSSRSASPSNTVPSYIHQPAKGTTTVGQKLVIDPSTGRSTTFNMVYPNANIINTNYRPQQTEIRHQSNPMTMMRNPVNIQPKPRFPTDGVSLPLTGLLPGNIHSIISKLLSMTSNLTELLSSVQENVLTEGNTDKLPFEISLKTLNSTQLQNRLTAVNCVKSAVNLFLQELAVNTSAEGVKALNISDRVSQKQTKDQVNIVGNSLDRNGAPKSIDTPHKFDLPGGENSPLITSTPKPSKITVDLSDETENDVILINSPSPKKPIKSENEAFSVVNGKENTSEKLNENTDSEKTIENIDSTEKASKNKDDDEKLSENKAAEQELLEAAAEEVDDEDDSDTLESDDQKSVTKKKKHGLVVKLGARSVDRKNKKKKNSDGRESSEENIDRKSKKIEEEESKGKVTSTTDKVEDSDASDQESIATRKTRSRLKDKCEEDDESELSQKTRKKSQDNSASDRELTPQRKTRTRSHDASVDENSKTRKTRSHSQDSTTDSKSPKKHSKADKSKSQNSEEKETNKKEKTPSKKTSKTRKGRESISDSEENEESETNKNEKSSSKKTSKAMKKKNLTSDNESSSNERVIKKGKKCDKSEKSTKSKKKSDKSESDSESTEDEESDFESDNSDDENWGSKKRRSLRRKTSGKSMKTDEKKSSSRKKRRGSDKSSDFDSDLEQDIEKLSKDPKKSASKKGKKTSENKSSKATKKENKKPVKKSKKGKGDSDDDSDDDDEEDTEDYDAEEKGMEIDMECPENAKAKEDLLKELDEIDEDEDNDSSDSEVTITPKKKTGKQNRKKGKMKIDSESETEEDVPKKKKKRDDLLDAKLSSSDSDFVSSKKKGKKRKAKSSSSKESDSEEEFIALGKKKKGKTKKKKAGTGRKRRRIKAPSSSSDEEEKISSDSDDDDAGSGSDDDDPNTPKRMKRKKIRKIKSDKKLGESTKSAVKAEEERRKRVAEKQKIFNGIVQEIDESSPTKCPITKQLVLDFNPETKKPLVEVDKGLVVKLKPHQVEAVQFIWDCTFETLKRSKEEDGSGCILAHCMGLGKTLSLIAFIHTMLTNKKTSMKTCLVVAPLNTILNWQYEFEMWQEFTTKEVDVYEMSNVKMNSDRAKVLTTWHEDGGVMIMGYDMFRNLTQGAHCRVKKQKKAFTDTLVDPGPDLVVCDEGHILKNDQSAISKAMNKIKTRRRIVLTGTPLQNNLIEYHCMVTFVKPDLLGTSKEFRNRFINPITNGQCADSTPHDVKIMKRRAHILHEKLNGCVQRKDYSALTKYLPPKHEYVIAVRLSTVQMQLYGKYLELAGIKDGEVPVGNRGARLFTDYQALMRIWTHPWVMKMDEIRQADKKLFDDESDFLDNSDYSGDEKSTDSSASEVSAKSDLVDTGRKTRSQKENDDEKESDESSNDSKESDDEKDEIEVVKKWTTRRNRGEELLSDPEEEGEQPVTTEWWAEFVKPEDEEKIELGGKLVLLFEILRMSEEIGDKVLVFSQSLLSLNLIEDFLERVDKKEREEREAKDKEENDKEKDEKDKKVNEGEKKEDDGEKKEDDDKNELVFGKHWTLGEDYFRMDGSTSAQHRKEMASKFNDPENYQCRLFLISTRAGGLGINLVAANRVIIFDASWNPSHDVQSIFRVYRFGQEKPVYVYRFLAQGTMEEKIYGRQVTKQSLSQRVVDEHQIDRHFNSRELAELYTFKPDRLDDPNRVEKTPMLPKDFMLAELMKSQKDWFVNYHEHDSLLENKIGEELDEDERKAAWEEFENERKGVMQIRQNFMANMPNMGFQNMMSQMQPQGLHYPYNVYGGMPGVSNPLNQQNLLQLVQEMKQRYPHLPQEQLTQQVQSVIRQMISRQIVQQQEMQKKQMEQKEYQYQRQLNNIQAQIRQQQLQLMQSTMQRAQGVPHQSGSQNNQQLPSNMAASTLLQQLKSKRN